MKQLWAPWRMEYIKGPRSGDCFFCKGLEEKKDRENLILYRGLHAAIILNRYPYNNGHLMIFPRRHTGDLSCLNREELFELTWLTRETVEVLKSAMGPSGFNVGINLGRSAGAGVEDHLHIHVVPRWEGDTNYMPVIGEVKVISEHLLATYDNLAPYFEGLEVETLG